jgi:RecA/RadA recombinase
LATSACSSLEIVRILKTEICSQIRIDRKTNTAEPKISIPLKISGLDVILGGFPSNVLTEIFGAAGSGKTQLCLQLAANLLKTESKAKVLFICTQERFSIDRMVSFLGDENSSLLDRIHVEYFLDPEVELHFFRFVIHNLMNEFKYSLIIYDGIASNTRNIDNVFQKAENLYNILFSFRYIFLTHSVCVVLTNQISDVPNDLEAESIKVSALGLTLENNVNIKIQLERCKIKNERIITLKKSLYTPLLSDRFIISDKHLKGCCE